MGEEEENVLRLGRMVVGRRMMGWWCRREEDGEGSRIFILGGKRGLLCVYNEVPTTAWSEANKVKLDGRE